MVTDSLTRLQKLEVSGPTTKKGRLQQDKGFIGKRKTKEKCTRIQIRRLGEECQVHPLEGKERRVVHLA